MVEKNSWPDHMLIQRFSISFKANGKCPIESLAKFCIYFPLLLGIISTPKLAVHTSLILKIFQAVLISLFTILQLSTLPFAINLIVNLSNDILYLVI